MKKKWRMGVTCTLFGVTLGYGVHEVMDRKVLQQTAQTHSVADQAKPSFNYAPPPLSQTDQLYTPLVHDTLIF